MMTLDEAIIHCEDVANDRAVFCEECAEEHRQLAEWLYELRARRQMDTQRVTCITCKHAGTTHIEGRRLPDDICTAQIWEKLNKAPHVIGHDLQEPIWCDHWEPKEVTEG